MSEIQDHQIKTFKKILKAGFDLDPVNKISNLGDRLFYDIVDHHRSKSHELPIVRASSLGDSNVQVENLSNNFYFYYVSLKLKRPLPAPFLWPISGLFGNVPLSGHVKDPHNCITNYEKLYHNVERIDRLAFLCGSPIQAAFAIHYLNQVSEYLDHDEILKTVLYETRHGMIDHIDSNAIDTKKLAEQFKFSYQGSHYYQMELSQKPTTFEQVILDWFDINNGGSSLHLKMKGVLPNFPILGSKILIASTPELEKAGVRRVDSTQTNDDFEIGIVPVAILNINEDWSGHYDKIRDLIHPAMWHLPIDHSDWTIRTNNKLNTCLLAFMIEICAAPVMKEFADCEDSHLLGWDFEEFGHEADH